MEAKLPTGLRTRTLLARFAISVPDLVSVSSYYSVGTWFDIVQDGILSVSAVRDTIYETGTVQYRMY